MLGYEIEYDLVYYVECRIWDLLVFFFNYKIFVLFIIILIVVVL